MPRTRTGRVVGRAPALVHPALPGRPPEGDPPSSRDPDRDARLPPLPSRQGGAHHGPVSPAVTSAATRPRSPGFGGRSRARPGDAGPPTAADAPGPPAPPLPWTDRPGRRGSRRRSGRPRRTSRTSCERLEANGVVVRYGSGVERRVRLVDPERIRHVLQTFRPLPEGAVDRFLRVLVGAPPVRVQALFDNGYSHRSRVASLGQPMRSGSVHRPRGGPRLWTVAALAMATLALAIPSAGGVALSSSNVHPLVNPYYSYSTGRVDVTLPSAQPYVELSDAQNASKSAALSVDEILEVAPASSSPQVVAVAFPSHLSRSTVRRRPGPRRSR